MHRTADFLVQRAAVSLHSLIAVMGIDAQHWRKKRQHDVGVESAVAHFGVEVPEAFRWIRGSADPAASFQQAPHGPQPDIGVEWRSDQLEDNGMRTFGQVDCRPGETALTDPGLTPQNDARSLQGPSPGERPAVLQIRQFFPPTDQRAGCEAGCVSFTDDPEMRDRALDALDRFGQPCFQFEPTADERFDGIRNHDGAGIGQAAHPCGEVCRKAEDVVLGEVEVDDSTVDADTDVDVEAEPPAHTFGELCHFVGDVQPSPDRTQHVVLVRGRVAEHRKQSVTLEEADMAFVAFDGGARPVAVPADHGAVDFGFDASRQCR